MLMRILTVFKIILFFIVIMTTIKSILYSEWTFTNRLNYNLFWALHYSSFILLLFLVLIGFLKSKILKIIFLILSIILTFLIFEIQFNPIDTSKYPIDIKILSFTKDEKIIARERKNGKTENIIYDTVKVNDVFIFRKIIK